MGCSCRDAVAGMRLQGCSCRDATLYVTPNLVSSGERLLREVRVGFERLVEKDCRIDTLNLAHCAYISQAPNVLFTAFSGIWAIVTLGRVCANIKQTLDYRTKAQPTGSANSRCCIYRSRQNIASQGCPAKTDELGRQSCNTSRGYNTNQLCQSCAGQ